MFLCFVGVYVCFDGGVNLDGGICAIFLWGNLFLSGILYCCVGSGLVALTENVWGNGGEFWARAL